MPNNKLPGLNADFSQYPVITFMSKKFAKVPFADWYPSDFHDVHVSNGDGSYELMYYSPACNMMAREGFQFVNMDTLKDKFWLKELSN